jgi:hypothetical protein
MGRPISANGVIIDVWRTGKGSDGSGRYVKQYHSADPQILGTSTSAKFIWRGDLCTPGLSHCQRRTN